MQNFWKERIWTTTRKYFTNTNKTAFNSWFAEIIKTMETDSLSGLILPGDFIRIPVENGDIVQVTFTGSPSPAGGVVTVERITVNESTSKREVLVTPRQFVKKDYIKLKNYGDRLKLNKMGLGFPYPFALSNMLKNLRQDEIVTFNNGMSFQCVENSGGLLTLRKISGSITGDGTLSGLYSVNRKFDMELNDAEMQYMYGKIRTELTDSVEGRVLSVLSSQNTISRIEQEMAANKQNERMIDAGPIRLVVRRNILSGTKWFTSENQPLSPTQLNNIFMWFATAPVLFTFERKESTPEKVYYDGLFNESLEGYFAEGKFENVFNMMASYCMHAAGDLNITVKSYIRNGMDYNAEGIEFTYVNGAVMLRKVKFTENDIKGQPDMSKNVPQQAFIEFCKEKYNSDYFLIRNKKKNVLMKGMPGLRW